MVLLCCSVAVVGELLGNIKYKLVQCANDGLPSLSLLESHQATEGKSASQVKDLIPLSPRGAHIIIIMAIICLVSVLVVMWRNAGCGKGGSMHAGWIGYWLLLWQRGGDERRRLE